MDVNTMELGVKEAPSDRHVLPSDYEFQPDAFARYIPHNQIPIDFAAPLSFHPSQMGTLPTNSLLPAEPRSLDYLFTPDKRQRLNQIPIARHPFHFQPPTPSYSFQNQMAHPSSLVHGFHPAYMLPVSYEFSAPGQPIPSRGGANNKEAYSPRFKRPNTALQDAYQTLLGQHYHQAPVEPIVQPTVQIQRFVLLEQPSAQQRKSYGKENR